MKKFLLFVTASCLFLCLSACSGASSNNGELAAYKAENEALKQQIQQLEEQLSVYTDGEIPVGDKTNQPQSPTEPITITLGQTVRIEDVLEFTITSCAWETQILPSNTSGSYSYKKDVGRNLPGVQRAANESEWAELFCGPHSGVRNKD